MEMKVLGCRRQHSSLLVPTGGVPPGGGRGPPPRHLRGSCVHTADYSAAADTHQLRADFQAGGRKSSGCWASPPLINDAGDSSSSLAKTEAGRGAVDPPAPRVGLRPGSASSCLSPASARLTGGAEPPLQPGEMPPSRRIGAPRAFLLPLLSFIFCSAPRGSASARRRIGSADFSKSDPGRKCSL